MDLKLIFTPYRISTITCNADMGKDINLDLNVLYNNIVIENDIKSFIWIQFLKENTENTRGVNPKKKRKSKQQTNKKCRFDNQITVIYKYDNDYYPNIKIFKNGNIQLTGIKDISHPEEIINDIISNIKNIYNNGIKKIFITNYNDTNPTERLMYLNFKVRMINSDFKIFTDNDKTDKFNIKRKELHNILISGKYNNKSSFQPNVYQGVKVEYFWNTDNLQKDGICRCSSNCFGKSTGTGDGHCKKITIAIFESGSILITGGVSFHQIDDVYKYICNIIQENQQNIKKRIVHELVI
jgi:TATA-box binding protein (TBP) (component of TFIID and TFIIIB)